MEALDELTDTSRRVIGAAIEVHRCLGPGYLESVYEDALALELSRRAVPYRRQETVEVRYKGARIGASRVDLLIRNELIVELKAVDNLLPIHKAQVMSYLKATGKKLGLLINFNVPVLSDGIKRIVLTQ